MAALVSKYLGQRLSLQNVFMHKWVRRNYYEAGQKTQTANLEIRSEYRKEKEDDCNKADLGLHRSQSEILESIDIDHKVPSERDTEALTYKSKHVFQPKNKFMNSSDNLLVCKRKDSAFSPDSSKKFPSENFRRPCKAAADSKDFMNLNSVRPRPAVD